MDWGIALQPNGLMLGIEYYPIDELNVEEASLLDDLGITSTLEVVVGTKRTIPLCPGVVGFIIFSAILFLFF